MISNLWLVIFGILLIHIVQVVPASDEEDEKRITPRLTLYHGSALFNYTLKQTEKLFRKIDVKKPVVIYIHGFIETLESESIKTVVSAYLQRGKENIIVFDWSEQAAWRYPESTASIEPLSKDLAECIQRLVKLGLDPKKLHIVGHSLGAHLAGLLVNFLDFKLPRVTGLDPAFIMFYPFGLKHINKHSAEQVDIIHTNGGLYGAPVDTGTVEFYVNGGSVQPGCPLFPDDFFYYLLAKGHPSPKSLCHHHRSWRIWAESLLNEKAFPAVKCVQTINLLPPTLISTGVCDTEDIAYVGNGLKKNAEGRYYFSTNDKSPFSMGMDGIKNINSFPMVRGVLSNIKRII